MVYRQAEKLWMLSVAVVLIVGSTAITRIVAVNEKTSQDAITALDKPDPAFVSVMAQAKLWERLRPMRLQRAAPPLVVPVDPLWRAEHRQRELHQETVAAKIWSP